MKLSIEFSPEEGKQFLSVFFSMLTNCLTNLTKLLQSVLDKSVLPMPVINDDLDESDDLYESDEDVFVDVPIGYKLAENPSFTVGNKVMLRIGSLIYSEYPNIFKHPLQVSTITNLKIHVKGILISVNDFEPLFPIEHFFVVEPDKPTNSPPTTKHLDSLPFVNGDRHIKVGSKVFVSRNTAKNGYPADQEAIENFLNLYELYEVTEAKVSPFSGWIKLEGLDQQFNSVNFILFE